MKSKDFEKEIETTTEEILENTTDVSEELTADAPKEKKPGKFITFMKSRKTKHGSIAVAIVAIAVAVVILVNMVCGMLVERFPNLMVDLTASQTYQLQDDTIEYINQLDTPIDIYILTSKKNFLRGLNAGGGANYFIQAEKLLNKMDAMSDNITIKYVDLSDNPTFETKYSDLNWTSNGNYLMILDTGKDYTALTLDQCFTFDSQSYYYSGSYSWTGTTIEQAVVTGILDVTSGDKVKVEFLTGSGQEEGIYGALKELLQKNAYEVSEVSLTTGDLSADSEIAITYGPTVDLSEEAIQKLEKWLDNDGKKGKTLIYLPIDQKVETPNLDKLLEQYGMKVNNELAFTMGNYAIGSPYLFLCDYVDDGTFRKTLKNPTIPTAALQSRSITITDENTATPLLNITDSAGALPFDVDTSNMTNDEINKYMKPDGVNVAVLGKKRNDDGTSSNVAVFGSYAMFYTSLLSTTTYNNANYIVNFCNTITQRGDMGITITSASTDYKELGLLTTTPTVVVGIVFIAIIPVTILLIGLIMYIRRRNS